VQPTELTVAERPPAIEAFGRTAVTLMVNQIGGTTVRSDELLFEPELVVRG
jgi:DNA-binding LacI/PurR family transcriptional regulator